MTPTTTDILGRQRGQIRQHKPHRIVADFKKPVDYRAVLATESHLAREWAFDQDIWLHSSHTVDLPTYSVSNDTWKVLRTFPLWRNPRDPMDKRIAVFYLGFDAQVYRTTANGLVPFDFEREVSQNNLRYLIVKLRTARRAI